jgi:hypothetical protein
VHAALHAATRQTSLAPAYGPWTLCGRSCVLGGLRKTHRLCTASRRKQPVGLTPRAARLLCQPRLARGRGQLAVPAGAKCSPSPRPFTLVREPSRASRQSRRAPSCIGRRRAVRLRRSPWQLPPPSFAPLDFRRPTFPLPPFNSRSPPRSSTHCNLVAVAGEPCSGGRHPLRTTEGGRRLLRRPGRPHRRHQVNPLAPYGHSPAPLHLSSGRRRPPLCRQGHIARIGKDPGSFQQTRDLWVNLKFRIRASV